MINAVFELEGIVADPKIALMHAHDPCVPHHYDLDKEPVSDKESEEIDELKLMQKRAQQAQVLFKPSGKAADLWNYIMLNKLGYEPKRLVTMRKKAATIRSQVNEVASKLVPQPVYAITPPKLTITDKSNRQFELTKTTDSNAVNMPDFMIKVQLTPDNKSFVVDDIQPDVAAQLYEGLLEKLTENSHHPAA